MRWNKQRQKENRGKEKIDEPVKVVKTYTTISMEKMLLGGAIKVNKLATIKSRRLEKKLW